jgi:murein L,D-transpeptidase YcbB/YkuD
MEYLIVNPSWNVPQSIIKNELMPHLDALRAQGYEIRTVNGRLYVRQPPGERNALGQIKFIFPNDYAVYMHDTPTRHLFATSRRAYSHGCVRVDQPFRLAEALLRPERGWSEERLRKMVGKTERRVNLPQPLPVHIAYFTLMVDETGNIQRFEDIYGYSRKARDLLGLGGGAGG